MAKTTSQLDLFREELKKLPDSFQTRGLWSSLHHVLVDYNSKLVDLHNAVRGDGNGEKGLIKRMDNLEDRADKIIEILERQEKESEKPQKVDRNWFVTRVLPGITIAIIAGVSTTIITLILLNAAKLLGS